jgi:hypothetical protein
MKCAKCNHEFERFEHYVRFNAMDLCEKCFWDIAVYRLGAEEKKIGFNGEEEDDTEESDYIEF